MPSPYVKGAVSLRRILRRLPEAARIELAQEAEGIGARQLAKAKAETPVRFGWLRSALAFKVLPKTLVLRIGLLAKRDRRRNFYGYILDQGRRAQTVTAKRRTKNGEISTYAMRIKGIDRERYNFVFGRRRDILQTELPKLRGVLDRVLSRAAAGVGDD